MGVLITTIIVILVEVLSVFVVDGRWNGVREQPRSLQGAVALKPPGALGSVTAEIEPFVFLESLLAEEDAVGLEKVQRLQQGRALVVSLILRGLLGCG